MRKHKYQSIIHIRLLYDSNKRKKRKAKKKAKCLRVRRNSKKKPKYKRERANITYNSHQNRTLFAPAHFSLIKSPEEVIEIGRAHV